jgi:hypothetical protein
VFVARKAGKIKRSGPLVLRGGAKKKDGEGGGGLEVNNMVMMFAIISGRVGQGIDDAA